jgi:L-lactate dehydrogenase complex protein LldG
MEPAAIARNYRLTDDRPPDVLLDVLVEDYKATVLRCTPPEVATTVAASLRRALGDHDPAGARCPGCPTACCAW